MMILRCYLEGDKFSAVTSCFVFFSYKVFSYSFMARSRNQKFIYKTIELKISSAMNDIYAVIFNLTPKDDMCVGYDLHLSFNPQMYIP